KNKRLRPLNLKKPGGFYNDTLFVESEILLYHDGRQNGVVSCVGAIESHFEIQSRILRELSMQEIIDCLDGYGNLGSVEGYPESIYEYDNGLSLDSSYPHTERVY
ncbi:LOW QUALITY PROTEIN: hypothetical protein MXB_4627, partial [Myxobolus squamalis]